MREGYLDEGSVPRYGRVTRIKEGFQDKGKQKVTRIRDFNQDREDFHDKGGLSGQ